MQWEHDFDHYVDAIVSLGIRREWAVAMVELAEVPKLPKGGSAIQQPTYKPQQARDLAAVALEDRDKRLARRKAREVSHSSPFVPELGLAYMNEVARELQVLRSDSLNGIEFVVPSTLQDRWPAVDFSELTQKLFEEMRVPAELIQPDNASSGAAREAHRRQRERYLELGGIRIPRCLDD